MAIAGWPGTLSMSNRRIHKIVTARQRREGGGFIVRRPFPSPDLDQLDPLLLLDELGPIVYGPGQAIGAPDHPHRGFETVTYILEGEGAHADSAGHEGIIGPGDVQWMTAGSGVVHREMPSDRIRREGGRVHGFQLWVNLPRRAKMVSPSYQEVPSASISEVDLGGGLGVARVIAGDAFGATGAVATHSPIVFQHWRLKPGAAIDVPVVGDDALGAYVFEGAVVIAGQRIGEGQLAVLDDGDAVSFRSDDEAQLLLLGGRRLNEPVARLGPFVMNTDAEVRQAFIDFEAGRMGQMLGGVG